MLIDADRADVFGRVLLGVEGLANMGVGGVAFWAHIGGFLAGVVLALFLRPGRH